jgi:hypothetical protein
MEAGGDGIYAGLLLQDCADWGVSKLSMLGDLLRGGVCGSVNLATVGTEKVNWKPLLLVSKLCRTCKGTSVCFLTSPILSHSPPVHMYSPSSPLYYSQGSYP